MKESQLRDLGLLPLGLGIFLAGWTPSASALTANSAGVFTGLDRRDGIPVGSRSAFFNLAVEGASPDISSVRVTFTGPDGESQFRDLMVDEEGNEWGFEERFEDPDDIPLVYPAGDYTFVFNNGDLSIPIPHVDPPSPFTSAMNLSPSGPEIPTSPASIDWDCSPSSLCDGDDPLNNFLVSIEDVGGEQVFSGFIHAERSLPTPGLTLDPATDYVLSVSLITVGLEMSRSLLTLRGERRSGETRYAASSRSARSAEG
jgi:hypothetical protein